MPADLEAGLLCHQGVVFIVIADGRVEHPAAAGAEQVVVPVRPEIETVCRRDLHVADLSGRGQNAQIAVYRAPADPLIHRVDIQIDLVRRRVVVPLFHGLKDQLTLFGASLDFHMIASY